MQICIHEIAISSHEGISCKVLVDGEIYIVPLNQEMKKLIKSSKHILNLNSYVQSAEGQRYILSKIRSY